MPSIMYFYYIFPLKRFMGMIEKTPTKSPYKLTFPYLAYGDCIRDTLSRSSYVKFATFLYKLG